MDEPFDLERFVKAQDRVFDDVVGELERGCKRSHWMWFIFPQHVALGMSSTAKHYGIRSLDEAKAYLAHPVLGMRLKRCCETLLRVEGRSAHEIFGWPDEMKLKSSLTLFELADPGEPLFSQCLRKFYGGERDARTVALVTGS